MLLFTDKLIEFEKHVVDSVCLVSTALDILDVIS